MKYFYCFLFIGILCFSIYSSEKTSIDWVKGKIYSSFSFSIKNDYNFARNSVKELENAKEKAKTNFYGILKKINIYENTSVLEFIENSNDKSTNLYSLLDNAKLNKIEYPDLNSVIVTYSIDIYGNDSLSSILVPDNDSFVEDIKNYTTFKNNATYTGIMIDARGEMNTFENNKTFVKPCLFVTIKDSNGKEILNRFNISPEIIKNKGMARYSYNINDKQTERIGNNPLKILAYGTGDNSGSVIIISQADAIKILSSEFTRKSLQNGNIVIVINP